MNRSEENIDTTPAQASAQDAPTFTLDLAVVQQTLGQKELTILMLNGEVQRLQVENFRLTSMLEGKGVTPINRAGRRAQTKTEA